MPTQNLLEPKRARRWQWKGLQDLIRHLDVTDGTLCEVGVYAGESAKLFLDSGKFQHIHCVDVWNNPIVEAAFDEFHAEHEDRVSKVKARSPQAAGLFPDGSLDVVYIDADHTYDAVKADIRAWHPKVRDGGWICGHDYGWPWLGVITAVGELLGKPKYVFREGSWMIRKGRLKEGSRPWKP